jgi:flagellin
VSQQDLAVSLRRLSTGLKINRGADDPAGLIISERLRAEIEGAGQAINNSQRAINVIATTEAGLDEVAALLIDIESLVIEAANRGAFSDAEVDANQTQIDSAIDSITRIANTSTFAGRKLLDGSLDYVVSGQAQSALSRISVLGAKFGTRANIPVDVEVFQSALQAELIFNASSINLPPDQTVNVDVQGPDGIVTLSFPGSASVNDIVNTINSVSDATGVTASAPTGSAVSLFSIGYGSDSFISVREIGSTGAFDLVDPSGSPAQRQEGRDAAATINGAPTIGDGLELSLNSFLLDLKVQLDPTFGTGSTTFTIESGGALFQLGPRVNTNQQENIGVGSVQANKLGDPVVGFLSDLKSGGNKSLRSQNFQDASKVLQEAITQVATLRGRLGAFERNTLQPNINQLQISVENLTAAESVIRDTEFAEETSELTRAQILVQAGTSIVAIANAQQQNVLSLLGG